MILRWRKTGFLFLAMFLVSSVITAQESQYENLQVLPKDISKERLTGIMKSWTKALGVRCNACHVGEPGAPLSTYDFASDEKRDKETARMMVKMTQAINEQHMSKLDKGNHKASQVSCATCHHGLAHPRTLGEILSINLARKGLDGAVQRYYSLRERYYGTDSLDFSEGSLGNFAQGLASEGKTDEAIRFLNLNLEFYPKSAQSYFLLGEAHAKKGEKDQAIKALEKSLELKPNPQIKERLNELKQ